MGKLIQDASAGAYAKKWSYQGQIKTADRETLKGLTTFDFAAE